ncbi:MAG: replication-associated recombination protein A [Pseudomonadota bacterium]
MSPDLLSDQEDDRAMAQRPLADRLRPQHLDEYSGQEHLIAPGKPLRRAIEEDRLHSMIFWGPPGTGKTTLARLIAHYCGADFITLSAVLSGVKDIREAVEKARNAQYQGRDTVLFVDEVHRFNKSQQDAFLPHIEDGTVCFVGATTENPSFELNNALLSRLRTYVLKRFDQTALEKIVDRALEDCERGLGELGLSLEEEARVMLLRSADGDARRALNLLETAADFAEDGLITADHLREVSAASLRRFDKGGDLFYDQISALHKSVRGSSPDGALYWFCRMLDGGCDPLYIARRLVRMASEDIGNADPRALRMALDACETFERLGSPEGELTLAQAVIYLASAPKSNAVYTAYKAAVKLASESGTAEVPEHLRNAPTQLMSELGYGAAYRYSHDEPGAFSPGQTYFPQELGEIALYQPVERGLEVKIAEKLKHLRELNKKND